MNIQRAAPRTSTIDVLDRILDKGVVIDAQLRVSLVGLHLVDIDARVIVSSIETYVKHASEVAVADRRPHVMVLAEPVAAVRERASRRASPRRHPRPRAQALAVYRCQSGCAFSRPPLSRGEAAACPYRADTTCELQRVPARPAA
jgi:gas vesicle structural protein